MPARLRPLAGRRPTRWLKSQRTMRARPRQPRAPGHRAGCRPFLGSPSPSRPIGGKEPLEAARRAPWPRHPAAKNVSGDLGDQRTWLRAGERDPVLAQRPTHLFGVAVRRPLHLASASVHIQPLPIEGRKRFQIPEREACEPPIWLLRQSNVTTIFPATSPVSSSRCASPIFSSGSRAPTSGWNRPALSCFAAASASSMSPSREPSTRACFTN